MSFSADDMAKLKRYIESKFGCSGISMKRREKADDSVEVMLNGEFIGLIYKDTEEGETSYDFNMAILDIDLEALPIAGVELFAIISEDRDPIFLRPRV